MSPPSLTVGQSGPLCGTITVPGDKSITQRALILAAMAEGISIVRHPLSGEDPRSTARALAKLGAGIAWKRDRVEIRGTGPVGFREPEGVLDFGNSGTGMRLALGALASRPLFCVLDGDSSLRNRPMGRVIEPLIRMGAEISGRGGDRYAPLALRGGDLRGIDFQSPVASAQVKSCVLLAALGADGTTTVTEPASSRDHTERLLPFFGCELGREGQTVSIVGPQPLRATGVRVPGDPSSAAFWVVAALVVPGSRLVIRHVGLNPGRTGFLAILERMGADLSWKIEEEWNGEPVGRIEAAFSRLRGTTIEAGEIPSAVDEIPILAVAAALAAGETVIAGAGELRVKESDRLAGVAAGLRALGAGVAENLEGLVIGGGAKLRGATVESRGDHRLAMSFAVAGLAARGTTTIDDTSTVATSYPGFERTLGRLAKGAR